MRATKLSLFWSLISLLFLTSPFLHGQDTTKSPLLNDFSKIQFENDLSKVPGITVEKIGDISVYSGRNLCLTTTDVSCARINSTAPSIFPSTIQIINVENPWPPIWFVASTLSGSGDQFFIDVNFQENRGLTTVAVDNRGSDQRSYYFLNDNMQIERIFTGHNYDVDFHDLQVDSAGNVLYISKIIKQFDVSNISGNTEDTATSVVGDLIVILDTNCQVIFSWNIFDHMDLEEMYYQIEESPAYGKGSKSIDFSHCNSVRWASDGNILYSFRHIGVGKIDVKTGNIIWRFGGKKSDFHLSPDDYFHHPKDFSQLNNTNQYSLYAYKDTDHHSTGMPIGFVFQIDSEGNYKRLRAVEPQPAMPSFAMGNFEVFSDASALINYGLRASLFGSSPEFAHYVGSDNIRIAAYHSPSGQAIYRVREHPFAIERPTISSDIDGLTVNNDNAKWYKVDSIGVSTFKAKGLIYTPLESGNYVATVPFGIGELVSTVKTYTVNYKSLGN